MRPRTALEVQPRGYSAFNLAYVNMCILALLFKETSCNGQPGKARAARISRKQGHSVS